MPRKTTLHKAEDDPDTEASMRPRPDAAENPISNLHPRPSSLLLQ